MDTINKKVEVKIADSSNICLGFHLRKHSGLLLEGCVEKGQPYITATQLKKVLESSKPRTDTDRIDFVDGSKRFQVYGDPGNFQIWDSEADSEGKEFILGNHDTWRQAVDALMDFEEDSQ
tara:strand:- start:957 stop:1316 length:360 start_codon:yes stop_codon:yes gene_type:complete